VVPPDFMFDKITAGESKSAEVFVMSFNDDSVDRRRTGSCFNAETRKYFLTFASSRSSDRRCQVPMLSRA